MISTMKASKPCTRDGGKLAADARFKSLSSSKEPVERRQYLAGGFFGIGFAVRNNPYRFRDLV
jgi:hypothetical protein